MRSRSFDAETGSHGIATATAVTAAAMTAASSARWTNDLLRTGGSQRTRTVRPPKRFCRLMAPSPAASARPLGEPVRRKPVHPRMRDEARLVPADTRNMLDQPLSQRLREIREGRTAPAEAEPALEAVPEALPEPPPRTPLGRLLVEKGVLSEADLGLA